MVQLHPWFKELGIKRAILDTIRASYFSGHSKYTKADGLFGVTDEIVSSMTNPVAWEKPAP